MTSACLEGKRVAVLYGGWSNEREVSLNSGAQVCEALRSQGVDAKLIDTLNGPAALKELIDGNFDLAFVALHGKGGEDGVIQGALEMLKIPYTGSGVQASALAMDKACAKAIYLASGIPAAASVTLESPQGWFSPEEIAERLGDKCVVKPVGDGSSVGMSIVHDAAQLPAAIDLAFENGTRVLIEEFVEGTEVTCAVLGNDNPEALPVIEIVPHAEFYNYEVKYSATGADHIIPARLPQAAYLCVQAYAVAAHKALGCRGVSRSDFIVKADGTPVILETNTIPGMTPTSLLPDAAKHAGYSFARLCEKIAELALED